MKQIGQEKITQLWNCLSSVFPVSSTEVMTCLNENTRFISNIDHIWQMLIPSPLLKHVQHSSLLLFKIDNDSKRRELRSSWSQGRSKTKRSKTMRQNCRGHEDMCKIILWRHAKWRRTQISFYTCCLTCWVFPTFSDFVKFQAFLQFWFWFSPTWI